MRNLTHFLQYGRSEFRHAGVLNPNEDHKNAIYRNLSLMSDTELETLREEALAFAAACLETLNDREVE